MCSCIRGIQLSLASNRHSKSFLKPTIPFQLYSTFSQRPYRPLNTPDNFRYYSIPKHSSSFALTQSFTSQTSLLKLTGHSQTSRSFSTMFKWIPSKWKSGISTSEYLVQETQALSQYLKRAQKFQRSFLWVVSSITGLILIVLYNWDTVKHRVGQEGAQVIREGIKSEDLQVSAADFSKALLNEILNDEKLVGEVSQWTMKILKESKTDLSSLVVEVLKSEIVFNEVQRITDSIIRHLCRQQWVQEKVGELLVAAISTDFSRNSAAQWVIDLLYREDVTANIQNVINQSVLNEPLVRSEVAKLANSILSDVLQNPKTIQLSQSHISAVLNAPEFQDLACGAAWNIVRKTFSPRWLIGTSTVVEPLIEPTSESTSNLHEAQFNMNLDSVLLSGTANESQEPIERDAAISDTNGQIEEQQITQLPDQGIGKWTMDEMEINKNSNQHEDRMSNAAVMQIDPLMDKVSNDEDTGRNCQFERTDIERDIIQVEDQPENAIFNQSSVDINQERRIEEIVIHVCDDQDTNELQNYIG